MRLTNLLLALAAAPSTLGVAVGTSTPRPLVLWHGMGVCFRHLAVPLTNVFPGDSHASPGMVEFGELIAKIHPGIFIHSVYVEEDQEQERRASFVRRMKSHGPPFRSSKYCSTET